jgi:1-acyl-sn-glycerol-3-phosphate acyltransferase
MQKIEQEPWQTRWKRRLTSIPILFALLIVYTILLPLILCLTMLFDIFKKNRLAATRGAIMLFFYIGLSNYCLGIGIVLWIIFGVWLPADNTFYLKLNFRLQWFWARILLTFGFSLYGLKLKVEGLEELEEGPYLLFMRHSSLADALLPANLASRNYGTLLRYVLKKEMLWEPCFDVVGNRIPNYFVNRSAEDNQVEIENVGKLATDLSAHEGVVIYPEGTRFSHKKRNALIEKYSGDANPALQERLSRYTHVLPPRFGGPMVLLKNAQHADVVFMAHYGLDKATHFSDLLAGRIIGSDISIRLWRVRAQDIPGEDEAIKSWIDVQWLEVNRFIAQKEASEQQTQSV